MIAADTNIVLRLFIQDDVKQSGKAVELFSKHTIWISKTVLLECEWVLRSALKHRRKAIHEMTDILIHLENVVVEDYESVFKAVQHYQTGMNFADALHLQSANHESSVFYSFDKKLVKLADKYGADAQLL